MDLFVFLWTLVIFLSVAWYAFLLFYIGAKGATEIRQMTRELQERNSSQETTNSRE